MGGCIHLDLKCCRCPVGKNGGSGVRASLTPGILAMFSVPFWWYWCCSGQQSRRNLHKWDTLWFWISSLSCPQLVTLVVGSDSEAQWQTKTAAAWRTVGGTFTKSPSRYDVSITSLRSFQHWRCNQWCAVKLAFEKLPKLLRWRHVSVFCLRFVGPWFYWVSSWLWVHWSWESWLFQSCLVCHPSSEVRRKHGDYWWRKPCKKDILFRSFWKNQNHFRLCKTLEKLPFLKTLRLVIAMWVFPKIMVPPNHPFW